MKLMMSLLEALSVLNERKIIKKCTNYYNNIKWFFITEQKCP